MKNHVPFLDTNAMPWEDGEFPGLFTKMLSANEATGARTALQCIDPKRGYEAPKVAHYHPDMDEELWMIKGEMSFDSQNWLGPRAYCYHPGNTVHGFKSAVRQESWFLSRISKPLKFGFVENPKQFTPYSLTGEKAKRPIRVVADAVAAAEWTEQKDAAGNVVLRRSVLSQHPETGEGSMLVEFTPHWTQKNPLHKHSSYKESFVISGSYTVADGTVFKAGCYSFIPAGTPDQPVVKSDGAQVYVNYGGPLDFIPVARQ